MIDCNGRNPEGGIEADYNEHCPPKAMPELSKSAQEQFDWYHRETFVEMSKLALKHFRRTPEPLSVAKVNKCLEKLHDTLNSLPEEVRELLTIRETFLFPNMGSDDWFTNEECVRTPGSSALDKMQEISSRTYHLPTHADASNRHYLVMEAITNFHIHGGKIEAGAKTPFASYLEDLFIDAGIGRTDISKVIHDYQRRVGHKI